MNDTEIIQLFFERNQQAIEEAHRQYGGYCLTIAKNILHNPQDVEECLSDAMLGAWNSIPPAMPEHLGPFLGKITRNLALNRLRADSAQKRGGKTILIPIDELLDCMESGDSPEARLEQKQLTKLLERFLDQLSREKRVVFVLRYWYMEPVSAIAKKLRCGESRVKSMLHRLRKELKHYLVQEGIDETSAII